MQPGERVAILAPNETAFVVAYLAVLRTGAVAVPLNATSPSHEVARELDAVTPAAVVASPAFVGPGASRGFAIRFETRRAGSDGTDESDDGFEPVARDAADLAVLLFTAGTAGAPRPAMLTHGSLLANIEQMQSHPGLRVTPDDVVLGVLPFFHVYGFNVALGLTLYAGASVSLVEHFHPVETLERVRADGVTTIPAVPAMFAGVVVARRIAKHRRTRSLAFASRSRARLTSRARSRARCASASVCRCTTATA